MGQLRRVGRLAATGAILAALALGLLPTGRAAAAGRQCFAQTGACAENAFLAYWGAHGGTEILGYPLDAPRLFPDGIIRQFYERAILEWHPENTGEYQVLLTRLGATLLGDDPHAAQPPGNCAAPCRTFAATNHTLRGAFLDYWNANGGLAVFGYPLTEEFTAINAADGKPYTVQYFERNRFEYHPENASRYRVLLGRLGAEALDALAAQVAALPVAATPDFDASVSPAAATVGTVFTVSFAHLHVNGVYTVALYDQSRGGRIVDAQQYTVGADATLVVEVDSGTLLPGPYRAALIDSKDDEIAAADFEVLAGR